MPIDFTAIDFETANGHASSACSVGLVKVRDGRIVERASWLIQPPHEHAEFLPFNTRIHGIRAEDVVGAPAWAEQLSRLVDFIDGDITVAHNAQFDMGVIAGACHVSVSPTPKLQYLCSVKVARKTYDLDSYRLPKAAAAAGFTDFQHHEALADSEACAAIIIDAAARHKATSVTELAKLTKLRLAILKAIPLKL
ncbi:MAG: 3'-5' exonuclease [Canibacter sp.]